MLKSILNRPRDLKRLFLYLERQIDLSPSLIKRILYFDQPVKDYQLFRVRQKYHQYLFWGNPIIFYYHLNDRQRHKFYQLLINSIIISFSEFDSALLFWYWVEFEIKYYPRTTLQNLFDQFIPVENYQDLRSSSNYIPTSLAERYYQIYLMNHRWYLVVTKYLPILPRVISYIEKVRNTRRRLVTFD